VLDVVGNADEPELAVAAGEERGQIVANLHLARHVEDEGREEQYAFGHRRCYGGSQRGHHADIRRLHRDGGAGRPQRRLQLVERRQGPVEHVEPLLDAGADLRCPAHPLGDRRGKQGHRQGCSCPHQCDDDDRRHPGRKSIAAGKFQQGRKGRPDQNRCHHRQQDRPAEIEACHGEQDEDADRRHLRGLLPQVGEAGERLRIVDDQGIPLFPLCPKKLHGGLSLGSAACRRRRRPYPICPRAIANQTPDRTHKFHIGPHAQQRAVPEKQAPRDTIRTCRRAQLQAYTIQLFAAPTVSAMTAPRMPSGFSGPIVESCEVWCSISELSSAPTRTTMAESHIHIMRPTTAPSDP
jgi:hypothetical protein